MHLQSRYLLSIGVAALICLCCAISADAAVPRGLQIDRSTDRTVGFSYRTHISSWDTLHYNGREVVRPLIDGARIRQNSDASIIQWVVSFDVAVPHERGFVLENDRVSTKQQTLHLSPALTPDDVLVPTPSPLEQKLSVTYSGVARDRHVATVHLVVAETRNGITTLCDRATGRITLAPGNGKRSELASRISADVVNPQAPFSVAATTRKMGEQVQGPVALGDVYMIPIESEGVYRISGQQLRDAGISIDANAAATLHIYGRGGTELSEIVDPPQNAELVEQPVVVRTDDGGNISEVVFYAAPDDGFAWGKTEPVHYIHHYDTKAGYLLTVGGASGLRSTQRNADENTPDHRPLLVKGYVYSEEELVNPYSSGSGRKWLGRTIENGGSLSYTTTLPGFVRNGDVQYRMVVAHKGNASGTVTISENNNIIAQRVIKPLPKYMDTYSATASGEISSSNIASDGRSVLRFQYSSTDQVSTGLLDWFEIHYPRGLVADNNEFTFFTEPTLKGVAEYSINGFSNSNIYGFDVTDRAHPVQIENAAPSGSLFVVRERLDSGVARRYYITSTVKSVSLTKISFANLRANPANTDVIIVTHPSLKESAEKFAEYRRSSSSLSVTVVTTDLIFNEFSYGIQDPTAIRDYLQYAFNNWSTKPSYVLLWGDGHYDYKHISTSAPNFLIPYESLDPDDADWGLNTYTTDDFFVRVAGNDSKPDISIGRLTIESNDLGERMIDRIKLYETASNEDDWRTRVGLIADDGPTTPGDTDQAIHLNQSEALVRFSIPPAYQTKKIYMVEYPTENIARGRRKPSVTGEYVSSLNTTGLLLLNWIGHGNPRVWAHEFVFERETTPPQMTNETKLFFLTAATCDFARFDLTETQSGAEELVHRKNGGAIGSFSASRIVFSFDNAEINSEFYKQLFTLEENGSVPLLGDVMYRVKQKLNGANDEKFFLLGDPTMRLLIPNYNVVFETINGASLTDTVNVKISALSTVTVTGHITKPRQQEIDASFNGVATVTLLDATKEVTVTDNDKYQTVNSFTMPGAALSRGSYSVVDGRFTATFVVPKDIAFSSEQARLYGYAINEQKHTAIGTSNNIIVDGVSDETYDDYAGPDMSIFMDSRHFVSGDVVRNNPILIVDLADKTGINTTGIGVGHDIEADFDAGSMIEILTSNFSTSLENPRAGTATKQIFGLGAGTHNVRVRAWDVLNNVSEASTVFRIATSDDGIVGTWVMNYPNPFSDFTTIRFQHNNQQPFTAEIRIYDVEGRMVADAPMEIKDMQTAEFQWNGRDNEGSILGSGVYVCSIRMTDDAGNVTNVAGKLALIR